MIIRGTQLQISKSGVVGFEFHMSQTQTQCTCILCYITSYIKYDSGETHEKCEEYSGKTGRPVHFKKGGGYAGSTSRTGSLSQGEKLIIPR